MPLIKIEHLADAALGVWETTESPEFFFNLLPPGYLGGFEPARFSERRVKEFLASRMLLRQLAGDELLVLTQDANGKMKDRDERWHFSLSHSGNRVAAIASKKFSAGIDIEQIHPRILKVLHKFLNEKERQMLGTSPDLWMATLCWSAKESIFKMLEKPGLSFSGEIALSIPREADCSFPARARAVSGWRDLVINFEKDTEFVLTYCMNRE